MFRKHWLDRFPSQTSVSLAGRSIHFRFKCHTFSKYRKKRKKWAHQMKVIHDERISPFKHIDLIVYGLVFWLVKSIECATRNFVHFDVGFGHDTPWQGMASWWIKLPVKSKWSFMAIFFSEFWTISFNFKRLKLQNEFISSKHESSERNRKKNANWIKLRPIWKRSMPFWPIDHAIYTRLWLCRFRRWTPSSLDISLI